ncbi:MAG TPA: CorA family divalent cation transporter [Steroidobacteraceae bacterium]
MAKIIVKHFRQIAVWPVQLMPVRPGQQVQRHWEQLDAAGASGAWRAVNDSGAGSSGNFSKRHYKEFVTFLPYVRRFLYGSAAGQEAATARTDCSIHRYERDDVQRVRVISSQGSPAIELEVGRIELLFFLDADIALLVFEMHASDLPLELAQDVLFRFARAYPGFWDECGDGGNCPHLVELCDAQGKVLAASDYGDTAHYLGFIAQHRVAAIASHWEFLLQPLLLERPGAVAPLRYRQLEYYRMPVMAYLACDDPHQLTRAQFVRLGLVTGPGGEDDLPYSAATLQDFEREYCNDSFWGRSGGHARADTRIIVTDAALIFVGSHGDRFFSGPETGLLSQFRGQFLWLFLIAHFHKAALLSMSDELAVAMNRLTVGVPDSVRAFKRTIRQMMEVFLRFTHRYWFHEISNQGVARDVFARLRRQLATAEIYHEVRSEVVDMNSYLDSDSLRRQANTVLRLTVVTIFGLIGTVATGVLGMNLLDETGSPFGRRILIFLVTVALTLAVTVYTITRSKRLADFLDVLSDERVGWDEKWRSLRVALLPARSGPSTRR